MTTFTIQDDFMLDGQPVKLISGARITSGLFLSIGRIVWKS